MNHFKDKDNKVWAFEADGSQDNLIAPGLTRMSDAEVEKHRNPPKTPEHLKALAKAAKASKVSKLKVMTKAGRSFNGDDKARVALSEAIQAAKILNLVEYEWKLAGNSVELLSISELEEAFALAVVGKSSILLDKLGKPSEEL